MESNTEIDRKSRIIGPVNEEVICPICVDILEDPVSCSICEAHFCKKCISKWLAKSKNLCMNRCQYNEKKAHPIINRMMRNLIFECINTPRGCTEKPTFDILKKHEDNCGFRKEQCSGCKECFLVLDLTKHKLTCPLVEIKCEECSKLILKKDFADHDKEKCFKEFVYEELAVKGKQIELLFKKIQELKSQLQEENKKPIPKDGFVVIDKPFGDKSYVDKSELQAWYDSYKDMGQPSIDSSNPREKYPSLSSTANGYYVWLGNSEWYYGTNTWTNMSRFSIPQDNFSANIATIARGLK